MKLHEINDPFDKDEEIRKWCTTFGLENYAYTVGFDDSVTVRTPLQIVNQEFTHLPFKFNECKANFSIQHCNKIQDLAGFPYKAFGSVYITDCNELTSLNGAQNSFAFGEVTLRDLPKLESLKFLPTIKHSLHVEKCGKVSEDLRGIQDHLKFTELGEGRLWWEFSKVKRGGLGILLIEGVEAIYDTDQFNDMPEPFRIISKYLYNAPDDIYGCQTELIDRGFEEFAEL